MHALEGQFRSPHFCLAHPPGSAVAMSLPPPLLAFLLAVDFFFASGATGLKHQVHYSGRVCAVRSGGCLIVTNMVIGTAQAPGAALSVVGNRTTSGVASYLLHILCRSVLYANFVHSIMADIKVERTRLPRDKLAGKVVQYQMQWSR